MNSLQICVCPHCHGPLTGSTSLACGACARSYRIDNGIADFAEGAYYDSFSEGDALSDHHQTGLRDELDGSIRRIRDFYIPLIRRTIPDARRILDCGCGNGVSVDELNATGFDGFGNDVSQLRKWQWRERQRKDRLVVASGIRLPFPDAFFDVVISSGVLEHIGVRETAVPQYTVHAFPYRDEQRRAFLRELARVTAPGGRVFLDFPNGAFPIDFWHGTGSPRRNRASEGFLPTFTDVAALSRDAVPGRRITAHSPYKRLQFRQASRHWWGRAFSAPLTFWFRAMCWPLIRPLAATALNPFLVLEIAKPR